MIMESQKRLFNLIKSILPPHVRPVDAVSDVLGINRNAAYDRINERVTLRLEEAEALCRHYRISLDGTIGLESDSTPFNYIPLAVDDPKQYLRYMEGLQASMERLAAADDPDLTFAADDIPMFHFMPYPELTYFKLYAWNQSMNRVDGSYESFIRTIDGPELRSVFRRIAAAYRKVPTSEIWTEETIHPILNLLAHYRDFGKFDSPDTLPKLRRQLAAILGCVEKWAADCSKGTDADAPPYWLYLCPVKPGSSIMLTRCDGKHAVRMKLYTINSIATDDPRLCAETRKWMMQTMSKSTCLSRASEIRRARFFDGMKEKIDALVP
ncbi:MAG: hypothetical protein EAS52_15675 [Parapedobacter sp.]|nr:MAG: hypothetical protein EAS52_15675 [Parapedobacter sp.]